MKEEAQKKKCLKYTAKEKKRDNESEKWKNKFGTNKDIKM